jgi:ectoine hydroxylase
MSGWSLKREERLYARCTVSIRSIESSLTLARHKDIAETAQELLDGQVYVYQSKLNVKSAFDGDIWDWHQDYIYWQTEDAMPTARVITVALFLDDVTEFNSPIIVVPGSHCHGVLETHDP